MIPKPTLAALRKELHTEKIVVRLPWEVPIRYLDEIESTHSLDFLSNCLLTTNILNVREENWKKQCRMTVL